jgi:thiamine-phosphate pyrophosphorylase
MPRVDFRLYLVTDRHQTLGRGLLPLVTQALNSGAGAVQLREKDLNSRELLGLGRDLLSSTAQRRAPLLINDRVDVALALGADGVHLRSDSMPVSVARRLLGPTRLIGVSAHSVDDVLDAASQGADFVVLGPIFATPSKQRYGPPIGVQVLTEAVQRVAVPIFAIGGVAAQHIPDVQRAGAFGIAVISAILGADDVSAATRLLVDRLAEKR